MTYQDANILLRDTCMSLLKTKIYDVTVHCWKCHKKMFKVNAWISFRSKLEKRTEIYTCWECKIKDKKIDGDGCFEY